MKVNIRMCLGCAAFAGALWVAPFSGAQQKQTPAAPRNMSYDVSRETSIQGTVISFTAAASSPMAGPHASIQTASGPLDVHLGNARFLESSHFSLSPGDSVRIVGETVVNGNSSQFLARIIQKGGQSLTVRSVRGFPVRPVVTNSASRAGGVL
ncbi:MAG TPA: hypothetical protein VGI46_01345 [Candidatus Acidoferrum sp.]|jgi:hypothetical protein